MVKILENLDFGPYFRKTSILINITVTSWYSSKFMKISIFVKIFENRDFGQNSTFSSNVLKNLDFSQNLQKSWFQAHLSKNFDFVQIYKNIDLGEKFR